MSEERLEIGEVLAGMSIHPFDDGDIPTWAFILVKIQGVDGEGWSFRTTSPPNREELLGALEVQVSILKKSLVKEWDE